MAWAIIGVTAVIFLLQQAMPPREFVATLYAFGLTPAKGLGNTTGFITYSFLHGGWWHTISNLWMFWIFSDNIEDVMGPWRFLLFYLLCGVLAGIAHMIANPGSLIPVVGASGAISGVLGAYFLLYPHAKITTLVFFLFLRLPAALYLGGWFLLQLFSGLNEGGAGIAWWAHLGGFIAGMLLLPFFRTNRPLPARLPEPPTRLVDDSKDPWGKFRSK